MKRPIIAIVLLSILLLLLTGCNPPPVSNEKIADQIFKSPQYYLNEKIILEGYVFNIREICVGILIYVEGASPCTVKAMFSATPVMTLEKSIELTDAEGTILDGCKSIEEPCHNFINGEIYLLEGILIENPITSIYPYQLKVSSSEKKEDPLQKK